MTINNSLPSASPFTSCHSAVSIGTADGGPLGDCVTDVCHCWLDQSFACPQFDTYADSCIANGVDLSNWRESVEFCREFLSSVPSCFTVFIEFLFSMSSCFTRF